MTRGPKLTPWFPPNVKPVRVGVYPTDIEPFNKQPGYSNWDGERWSMQYASAELAAGRSESWDEQSKRWRGLASDPLKVAK